MNKNGTVSLSELSGETTEIELVSPNGKRFTIRMRSLRHGEMKSLRRRVKMPTPPVGDIRRNPKTGQVERVYNENDATYIEALDEANEKLALLGVLLSAENLDVPGETDDEKVNAFRDVVGAWASTQLITAFNRVNGFAGLEAEQVAPFAVANSPSSPDSVGPTETGNN